MEQYINYLNRTGEKVAFNWRGKSSILIEGKKYLFKTEWKSSFYFIVEKSGGEKVLLLEGKK